MILTRSPQLARLEKSEIYFWTATISHWNRLLDNDEYKDVITNCLQYLSNKGCIDVFAFVIMPNHFHQLWRVNEPNGKEPPQGSFLKYTAHMFKKMLRKENEIELDRYRVNSWNQNFEFWQPLSLGIRVPTWKIAMQKLNYIYNNPLQDHWKLVQNPCDYKYSSASFYGQKDKHFAFLKNIGQNISKELIYWLHVFLSPTKSFSQNLSYCQ